MPLVTSVLGVLAATKLLAPLTSTNSAPPTEQTIPDEPAPLEAIPLEDIEPEPSLDAPLPTRGLQYAAAGPPIQVPAVMRPIEFPQPRRSPPSKASTEPLDDEEKDQGHTRWDGVSWTAFVDAYAGINAGLPVPQTGGNGYRAFDVSNGFALHWAGVGVSYEGDQVGGTVDLRFGPGSALYNGSDARLGLEYVKQAYATWIPKAATGKLRLDLGKFDTLYGAEVADSQSNYNYTRGALNWLAQPLFHTGVRATLQLSEKASIAALVVNGWNNSIDNNFGKSAGLQLGLTPSDRLRVYAGYLGGPENDREQRVACADDTAFETTSGQCAPSPGTRAAQSVVEAHRVERRLRHFGDLIIAAQPTPTFALLANANVGHDEVITNPVTGDYDRVLWWGAAVASRYRLTDDWAVAARAEVVHDPQGFTSGATDDRDRPTNLLLGTGTATLEFSPVDLLILKLDSRYDRASRPSFRAGVSGATPHQLTFTLGAVVAMGR